MNARLSSRQVSIGVWSTAAAVIAIVFVGSPTAPRADAQFEQNDTPEVLTRGPVHEAFAETIAFDPQPGIVVAKGPPQDIQEIPPDLRPDGDNVTWIPG